MSAVETLPTKQKHLIGVGAAIAAGCHSCTTSYVSAAREAGACERGVRFAIETGLSGRELAAAATQSFANQAFPNPRLDASDRETRAHLGALIRVAAAFAASAATSLQKEIEAARALGATNDQIRLAVQIARTTKRGAETATEAALSEALGATTAQDTSIPCSTPTCCETSAGCEAPGATDQAIGVGDCASGPCGCSAQGERAYETMRIPAKTAARL